VLPERAIGETRALTPESKVRMNMGTSRSAHIVCVAIVGLAVVGCAYPAKFSGGGWIPSTSGGSKDKANVGFNAADCDPSGTAASGHFNFHDKMAAGFAALGGVKFGGFVDDAGECTADTGAAGLVVACDQTGIAVPVGFCAPDASNLGVDIVYVSTNPKNPGEGVAVACVHDGGEGGSSSGDLFAVRVLTGPFTGYVNSGQIKGNMQQGICSCTDGIDNDGDTFVDDADPGCNLIDGPNGSETDL